MQILVSKVLIVIAFRLKKCQTHNNGGPGLVVTGGAPYTEGCSDCLKRQKSAKKWMGWPKRATLSGYKVQKDSGISKSSSATVSSTYEA